MKLTSHLLNIILLITISTYAELPFKKVIIWGHKLHSSTHSYIHYAFDKAFRHLGYDTYWLDKNDALGNFDFSNSLFITEGQVDQYIPLREDCRYILHNCDNPKYAALRRAGNCITLQVYTHDALTNHKSITKIDSCTMYTIQDKTIYMPWATDLLPYEIDEIKKQVPSFKKEHTIYWVGTIWDGVFGNRDKINHFTQAAQENGIPFQRMASVSTPINIALIQKSYMAPALQGKWQCEKGYIPCRIFKNISYGAMGITNSKMVYELFDKKIIFHEDCHKLFYDAQKRIKTMTLHELYELMDIVRDKHTYVNRINHLIAFINMVKPLPGS